ncbi:cysteine hydrolase [Flavobacterium sp. MR2016-29]|uniref:cysteine hydrolase family protein n=1 Tax=Flavobacterium sp. MR2016-29 TaxID=2783795 RepID=UPI00293BF544|nr:cysteine hydrolase [Flavobacterium sp. MR2016-29]
MLTSLQDSTVIVENIAQAIKVARSKNIPIIYATLGFKNGASEISPNNKTFAKTREHIININFDDFTKVHPALAPQENDIQVIKRRISAFAGSALEVVLRSKDIKHLVMTGYATSGIVLSTTTEAADKDYKITILSDGCADTDEEVHHVLTTKVFLRYANVTTIKEWENS